MLVELPIIEQSPFESDSVLAVAILDNGVISSFQIHREIYTTFLVVIVRRNGAAILHGGGVILERRSGE